jgi:hypothetical protein
MGLFVHFRGVFECVRCRRASDTCIQTKLLKHEVDNSSQEYCVGDTEALVGLGDYCPLHTWCGGSFLIVALGDWACSHCGLNWQWARAVFDLCPGVSPPTVTIRELSEFQPWRASDLGSIHFVEAELAELSGFWARRPVYNWPEGLARWEACPVPERCERVAAGFRKWCREVAGVSPDVEQSVAADPHRIRHF